jgi:dolichyl-phosphate beta-glucosyltransferase
VFPVQHLERWAFDVELFYLCKYFQIPVGEVPVVWREIEGSKLNVVWASLTMARDFLLIKVFYMLGLWKVTDYYNIP